MKLLYAEDEQSLSEAIVDILTYHHYLVDAVYNGNDALYYATNEQYDGIILDIMMPGLDGLEVLQKLREQNINTPILLLTAKGEVEDKIKGLDLGADDYLPKPFHMQELLARIRAMLRRKDQYIPDTTQVGNIYLNKQTYELSSLTQTITLSKLEFQLMELLIDNQGRYLKSETIFQKVWGYNSDADIGIVWVYISYLRKHLTTLNANVSIHVRRNIGYTLEVKND